MDDWVDDPSSSGPSCDRCGEPWDGDKCSSSDCYCTLCPFCGQQAVDPDGCVHLVALFSGGEDLLGAPPPLAAAKAEPTEGQVDAAFGDDADLARAVWARGFTTEPDDEDRELPIARGYKGARCVEGYLDSGWISDGPWVVVYVFDCNAWAAYRDAALERLARGVAALAG
jgi:hypothetical protein